MTIVITIFPFSLECDVVCYGQPALEKGRDMVNIKRSSE